MLELQALEYEHEGVTLRGQLALPEADGARPGVLVMHNAHGLGEQVRERALRLARAGYVALATDMYGGGQLFASKAETGGPFAALQADGHLLRGRVAATLEALRALPQVDPARVAAIGFCFGGQCVLELARSGADVRAVVSFHGLLHTHAPAEPGAVKARVLVLTGARDPYVPAAHVEALRQELTQSGADWQITTYGEGWHAFSDPDAEAKQVPGVRYDPLLDKLSWAQATAFLEAALVA